MYTAHSLRLRRELCGVGCALAARSNLLDGACVASADDQGFEETSHKQGLGSSGKRQHK